jgi:hypothetical protein
VAREAPQSGNAARKVRSLNLVELNLTQVHTWQERLHSLEMQLEKSEDLRTRALRARDEKERHTHELESELRRFEGSSRVQVSSSWLN